MSAVAKLMPKPPARVDNKKQNFEELGALNRSIRTCRSAPLILPSIRSYPHFCKRIYKSTYPIKHVRIQICRSSNYCKRNYCKKQTNKQTGLSSLSKKSELCEPQSLNAQPVLQTLGICMTQHFKSGLNSEPVFQNFGEMHDLTL